MTIRQIIIRPSDQAVIAQYEDPAGRPGNVTFSTTGNATIAAIVADALSSLPTEKDNPAKSQIEQEIIELEYQITQLKRSIGEA